MTDLFAKPQQPYAYRLTTYDAANRATKMVFVGVSDAADKLFDVHGCADTVLIKVERTVAAGAPTSD